MIDGSFGARRGGFDGGWCSTEGWLEYAVISASRAWIVAM
jgi:hypothetical protein